MWIDAIIILSINSLLASVQPDRFKKTIFWYLPTFNARTIISERAIGLEWHLLISVSTISRWSKRHLILVAKMEKERAIWELEPFFGFDLVRESRPRSDGAENRWHESSGFVRSLVCGSTFFSSLRLKCMASIDFMMKCWKKLCVMCRKSEEIIGEWHQKWSLLSIV